MIHRLKIVGWFALLIFTSFAIVLITVLLIPIWVIVWVVCGWWFPKEIVNWLEDNFPGEVTS